MVAPLLEESRTARPTSGRYFISVTWQVLFLPSFLSVSSRVHAGLACSFDQVTFLKLTISNSGIGGGRGTGGDIFIHSYV